MKVITICGSMRFSKDIMKIATELETDKGYCVLQPVYNFDNNVLGEAELQNIVKAHYKKIDISDAVFVVNVGGYIGKSVTEEIEYAKSLNKEILYLEKLF
ncbi:MAG: hypothetical protein K2O89_00595 [Clostridia bacterium]|nr:hypothetical protein [Clostridia bacterium]